jgi:hypothetical protein
MTIPSLAERIDMAETFLRTLYPDPIEAFGVLWESTTSSACFDLSESEQLARMARLAVERSDDHNIWYKVNPITEKVEKGRHGRKDQVAYLASLFVDCDVDPRGSEKAPSQADALLILRSLDPAPTLCVNSGGGIHGYWLLKEPQPIEPETNLDADAAQLIEDRLEATVNQAIARTGASWIVDPAATDISRILRLPGTINHKGGGRRLVQIVHD